VGQPFLLLSPPSDEAATASRATLHTHLLLLWGRMHVRLCRATAAALLLRRSSGDVVRFISYGITVAALELSSLFFFCKVKEKT